MQVTNKDGKVIDISTEEMLKNKSLNINQTPTEIIMEMASEKASCLVDDYLLSEDVKQANQEGYIYINSKEYYPTKSLTCLQYPLNKGLKSGFKAELVTIRPAKRIITAGVLACILMEIVQNEMHGGQAIPAFDYYLAPYVRMTFKEEINKIGDFIGKDLLYLHNYNIKDYITKSVKGLKDDEKYIQQAVNNTVRKVQQAMEAFLNNMNTVHSRSGNRVIFSSINYGTDTSAEGRCIIREVLTATERGVGNNETPIFPMQIWKKKRGINYLPEDKNYDLYKYACEITAKRYFPNYINLDATFNQNEKWKEEDSERYKYECAMMGCRTRVFENRFGEKSSIGRGCLSYSTINLPKIAIESAKEAQEKTNKKFELGRNSEKYITEEYKEIVKEIFFNKLEKYAEIISKQLYDRYKFQATATAKQFPLLMSGLWLESEKLKQNDIVEPVLKHGTLGVGFIGLAEALIVLMGKHHGESEEAQKLGIEIVENLEKIAEASSNKYNLNFTLFATPADRLSDKLAKMDKNKYGCIMGVNDREYYTNSNHIPSWYECSYEHRAKIESPYHRMMKGGHIFYARLENGVKHKPEEIENLVRLMDKYDLGYGAVNFAKLKCIDCGFEIEKKKVKYCPVCDSQNIETLEKIADKLKFKEI